MYDVIVIGGGLLGSFALRNLARYKLKAALLERREDLCTGISRANTAIVYSGCDNKPGTLKTEMCVRAAQTFPKLCAELGVRYSPCGSVMISFGAGADRILQKKYAQGITNGVRDIRLLTGQEVLELEPNVSPSVRSGLYVPDTGTVMPWELCLAAAENAVANGAEIILNAEVSAITRLPGGGYAVHAGDRIYNTRAVINCAGMSADKLHELVNKPIVRIIPTAGDYLVLDTKAAGHISRVIFHETEEKGKGITLVPTIGGNILIGPTTRDETGAFETSIDGLHELRKLTAEVMPNLPLEYVIRSFGTTRPNPQYVADDRSVNDFSIIEAANQPFISLIGVKTPGLTCANELGAHVAEKIAAKLSALPNHRFNPVRKPRVIIGELPHDLRILAVRKNPAYGRIICRCKSISEGEIIDAIHAPIGAVTLDGVKRRVGAGFGRCQGGFCAQRIVEIMARELCCNPEDITKDGGGSYILR